MGEISTIQWTESSWNPWHGCKKVSAGCRYCYMYRDKEKYGQDPTIVMRSKTKFSEPLKWIEGRMIFTCSWSDWFIKEADEWREEAWKIIKDTPQHTYQILTKRPERILRHLPSDWGDGYPNVWLGVSVENQSMTVTDRIYDLCNVPAAIRFISFEPLISHPSRCVTDKIDWIIIGGESGNDNGKYRYRPCEFFWIEHLIEWYREDAPRTAIFVKQLGTHLSKQLKMSDRHGGKIDEFPEHLRIREFPTTLPQKS
jgi:protein gp37